MPACFLVPFACSTLFHLFTLWWCISSELLCGFYRQPIDRFCLLTNLVSSCLLIGGLRPLLFKVIIEHSHLIAVIMLLISGVIVYILSGTCYFDNYSCIFFSFSFLVIFILLFILKLCFLYFPQIQFVGFNFLLRIFILWTVSLSFSIMVDRFPGCQSR